MPSSSAPTPGPIDPARAQENNTGRILGVSALLYVLAMTFVCLRLYVRVWMVKTPGRDDYCMIGALLGSLAGLIVFIIQSFHGLGHHEDTISQEDMKDLEQASFWMTILCGAAGFAFLKVSIAFSLLRLSTGRWYVWSLWAFIVVVIIYSICSIFPFLLFCKPMEGYWDKSIKATCYPITLFVQFALVNTSFNIFTDIAFATFPIPIIWNLQMKRRARFYLIGVLSLGYFAVAMGIVKAVYQLSYGTEKDRTFDSNVQFWSSMQINVGIIAACAPTLKPLVGRVLKLSSYGVNGYRYGNGYGGHGASGAGYGSRSQGRAAVTASQSAGGGHGDFELAERNKGHSHAKGESITTATTFYRNGSADASGSEEMILQETDPEARFSPGGIMRTREVKVSVN